MQVVSRVRRDSTSLPPTNPQANSNMIITGFS
jgi:hypothetical protein